MYWLSLLAFIVVNATTYLRFFLDKRRAERSEWRIPESELLLLALLGGTPAAFVARHRLRHKTRKEPFSTLLMIVAALQVGAVAGFALV